MNERTPSGTVPPLREQALAAAGVDGIELHFAHDVSITCVVGLGEPFKWDVWDARAKHPGARNVVSGLTLEAAIAEAVAQTKKTPKTPWVRRGR